MEKQAVNTIPVHANHPNEGTKLIPSEMQSDTDSNEQLPMGYTQDDEPDISTATYLTPTKQLRYIYIFIGIGAIILVAALLLIASAVS